MKYPAKKIGPWDLDKIFQVPQWKKSDTAAQPGLTGILYESIPYDGKQVRCDIEEAKDLAAIMPEKATHYFINLVDENNYLVSYPEAIQTAVNGRKKLYSGNALLAL